MRVLHISNIMLIVKHKQFVYRLNTPEQGCFSYNTPTTYPRIGFVFLKKGVRVVFVLSNLCISLLGNSTCHIHLLQYTVYGVACKANANPMCFFIASEIYNSST